MIGRIAGTLLVKQPPYILVDVGGIGYEIEVPMSTFYNLPGTGEKTALLTHLAVREDGHFLYGFLTESERAAFRQLIRISGVGARTALALLSGLSVEELAQAVAQQQSGRLVKIPGIGKKTAERLLLELKDKMGTLPGAGTGVGGASAPVSDTRNDIVNALLTLGYNDREAASAMRNLPPELSVSEGIRHALKALSKP
jgi:Holliday junction DNA helicase RuvA